MKLLALGLFVFTLSSEARPSQDFERFCADIKRNGAQSVNIPDRDMEACFAAAKEGHRYFTAEASAESDAYFRREAKACNAAYYEAERKAQAACNEELAKLPERTHRCDSLMVFKSNVFRATNKAPKVTCSQRGVSVLKKNPVWTDTGYGVNEAPAAAETTAPASAAN